MYKINPAGDTVVVDTVGSNSDDFDEFLDALPENDCRYCVYDFLYTNADGCVFNKIVFVMWTVRLSRNVYVNVCVWGKGVQEFRTVISSCLALIIELIKKNTLCVPCAHTWQSFWPRPRTARDCENKIENALRVVKGYPQGARRIRVVHGT